EAIQPVRVVPAEVSGGGAKVGETRHVAMGVVPEAERRRVRTGGAEGAACEAGAVPPPTSAATVVDRAGGGVADAAGTARMGRVGAAVLHLQDVADGVVDVALDVPAHVLIHVRVVVPDVEGVVSVGRCGRFASTVPCLAEVLSTACLDQLVQGVVDVVVA